MRAVAGLVIAGMCFAQPATFDAASVKTVSLASHPVFGNSGGPGSGDPGRIHLCCVGMFSLLMRAYDVQIDQISGPSWIMDNMGPTLYQVDATMPPETTKAQFQLMMRGLLVERFHLEVHRETRNFPGYDLIVARDGPKLKESIPGTESHMTTSLGHGMIRVQARAKPLADLVKGMGSLIAQSLGADPTDFASRKPRVTDKTGLTGEYDFVLEFACDGCRGLGANLPMLGERGDAAAAEPSESGLPTVFTALEKQLGLRLEKTRDIPLDVIVVDHVERIPAQN
jgi:uncharacterized protein (TIGR03435 family)